MVKKNVTTTLGWEPRINDQLHKDTIELANSDASNLAVRRLQATECREQASFGALGGHWSDHSKAGMSVQE